MPGESTVPDHPKDRVGPAKAGCVTGFRTSPAGAVFRFRLVFSGLRVGLTQRVDHLRKHTSIETDFPRSTRRQSPGSQPQAGPRPAEIGVKIGFARVSNGPYSTPKKAPGGGGGFPRRRRSALYGRPLGFGFGRVVGGFLALAFEHEELLLRISFAVHTLDFSDGLFVIGLGVSKFSAFEPQ